MADEKRPVLWSPKAQDDLSNIWNYHASAASPQTADDVLRDIGKTCGMLERHPLAGRPRDEIRAKLRSIPANPHVVFYRVRKDRVEIVRVLHGSRDIDEIFADKKD